MPAKVNRIFIDTQGNSGPRKFCDICKAYYTWIASSYRCPSCGTEGDVTKSNTKVLKARTLQPFVGNKKSVKKQEDREDLPEGARWVNPE